jgi:hypothetical protein
MIAAFIVVIQGDTFVLQQVRGHHPFNGPDEMSIKKLFKGSPTLLNYKTVKSKDDYFPCNGIWSPGKGAVSIRTLITKYQKEKVNKSNKFSKLKEMYVGKNVNRNFYFTEDNLVDFMKEHYPHE